MAFTVMRRHCENDEKALATRIPSTTRCSGCGGGHHTGLVVRPIERRVPFALMVSGVRD